MKTYISDNFPLKKLECQYFDICNDYIPGDCGFDQPCAKRQLLRKHLEDYVEMDCLRVQIKLILDEKLG